MFSLSTYIKDGYERVGMVLGDSMMDLNEALSATCTDPPFRPVESMLELLDRWDELFPHCRAVAETAGGRLVPTAASTLLPPVPRPGKMINVGLNFVDHAEEMGIPLPDSDFRPNFFFKGDRHCAIGPLALIEPSSGRVDWEGEVALVIGRRCRKVDPAEAMDHVAGYTCHNDVTDRSLMMRPDGSLDFLAGKTRDTFGPLGPTLVPREFVPDVRALRVRLRVNGEVMQDFACAGMLWGPAECVSYLSSVFTLEPGDVVGLGTGAGVGWAKGLPSGPRTFPDVLAHFFSGGGRYLERGDNVAVEIDGLGRLENQVA